MCLGRDGAEALHFHHDEKEIPSCILESGPAGIETNEVERLAWRASGAGGNRHEGVDRSTSLGIRFDWTSTIDIASLGSKLARILFFLVSPLTAVHGDFLKSCLEYHRMCFVFVPCNVRYEVAVWDFHPRFRQQVDWQLDAEHVTYNIVLRRQSIYPISDRPCSFTGSIARRSE